MGPRPRIAIVAGESSGDQLGAGLIDAARRLRPDLEFVGVAGAAMRAAGCDPWFQTEELSVMGLAEVLRHLPRLARLKHALTRRLLAERPAVFVGIDSPDFNLRVEAQVHAAGIPTVQYVCPSVWAWRRGRVRVIRRACDRVLCLLPFEVPFLAGSGVAATFVGHPFADQIPQGLGHEAARNLLGIRTSTVIGLLPGSRLSEVIRLGPVFLQTAERLRHEVPGISFVAPMARPDLRRVFEAQRAAHAPAIDLLLTDGRARDVMAASDVVLTASGTATLEAMLIGRPMVVAYRLAPLTYQLGRRLKLVKVAHISLPNLLAGAELVPEFLQDQVTPDSLASAVTGLLQSPERVRVLQARFGQLHQALRRGASDRAAQAVLNVAGLL